MTIAGKKVLLGLFVILLLLSSLPACAELQLKPGDVLAVSTKEPQKIFVRQQSDWDAGWQGYASNPDVKGFWDIAVAPNGDVFVSSPVDFSVYKYRDGKLVDTFRDVSSLFGIALRPTDGALLAVSRSLMSVRIWNEASREWQPYVTGISESGVRHLDPYKITFGADRNGDGTQDLYISLMDTDADKRGIWWADGKGDSSVKKFASHPTAAGQHFCSAWGSDGNFYVGINGTSSTPGTIAKFDKDGKYISDVVVAPNVYAPQKIIFAPGRQQPAEPSMYFLDAGGYLIAEYTVAGDLIEKTPCNTPIGPKYPFSMAIVPGQDAK
ncbi:MAG: NHL repeat-containing protein [Armatimonadota bacterium]